MRKYECVMVLHPGASAEDTEVILNRFEKSVADHGGEIIKKDDWGMRRLEYEIERQTNAHYWFYNFTANAALTAAADRDMRLDDKVIRHLIVRDEEWAARNSAAKARRSQPVEEEDHGA